MTSGIISIICKDRGFRPPQFVHRKTSCNFSLLKLPVPDQISLSLFLSLFLVIKWKDKRCRRDKTRWRLHGNGAGENCRNELHTLQAYLLLTSLLYLLFLRFPPLQKIEVTNKSVFELLTKTTEYLQPNPGTIQISDLFTAICTGLH